MSDQHNNHRSPSSGLDNIEEEGREDVRIEGSRMSSDDIISAELPLYNEAVQELSNVSMPGYSTTPPADGRATSGGAGDRPHSTDGAQQPEIEVIKTNDYASVKESSSDFISTSSDGQQTAAFLIEYDPEQGSGEQRTASRTSDRASSQAIEKRIASRVSFAKTAPSAIANRASSSENRQSGNRLALRRLSKGSASSSPSSSLHSKGSHSSSISKNFRYNILRRSTALKRFGRPKSSEDMNENMKLVTRNKGYRYSIDQPVLISNEESHLATCVNRHGYPPGKGGTSEERRGPYNYVLGIVKTVNFEENAVFYTVTREDTGEDVRGDPDFMEPILTQAGEEAARMVAQEFALGSALYDNAEDDGFHTLGGENSGHWKIFGNALELLLLPLLLLYDLFVLIIGARLFRWTETSYIFSIRQAHGFLNGLKPYNFSLRITTVNLIVLCSIWYLFIDQARLAFSPTKYDDISAWISLIVWIILALELAFEVFIRPDDYTFLILSDRAYTPATVRFISGLHLWIEFVSLIFFVPEFICLFRSDLTCDGRQSFSFSNASMLAIMGPSPLDSLAGRAFYACIRLRVFGLVRLWKNMWVNQNFLKRERKKMMELKRRSMDKTERHLDASINSTVATDSDDLMNSITAFDRNRMEQKQRDAALINASNIGTALMVTNSYRALTILCAILGLFPMITLIYPSGVTNFVTHEMVTQLQSTNAMITIENDDNCDFLVDSVEAWTSLWYSRERNLITSDTDDFMLALIIKPARCADEFEALKVGNIAFSKVACVAWQSKLEIDLGDGECILGKLEGTEGNNLHEFAQYFDLRVGNIKSVMSEIEINQLQLQNGTTFFQQDYQIAGCFNETHAIENSALASCFLQLCLLMTVICGLAILRRDAEDMVLGPLRSMLKIVARYAKNPLASAKSSGGKDNQSLSVMSESESDASSFASDGDGSDGDGFGTYETEQLITAVGKITDLLRKCWGVAGADIISTNLASREGALAEVFNPTVPGKSVYALFAFAAINGFDHALKCLGGDVMILINDVAMVLHEEVYRWGFGDSGQCNKNLGAAFLMVFRIGLVKEVREKLDEATRVVFSTSETKKSVKKKNSRLPSSSNHRSSSGNMINSRDRTNSMHMASKNESDAMTNAMKLSLQSLPGIATFTDRAVIGMLKSFAGIHRDNKLRAWSRDFRLSAGVGAFEVNMIFGMDAGWAVEGAVGSEYKIDATYLSPHVNMASRMMSACKHYGVTILLSEAVQELMSEAARTKLRNVDRVTVKGSIRIQKIFTYDARHKGADFFLFSRSDDLADLDAEQYVPSIWNTDQDLQAMRHHVTDDFETEFAAGMKAYYAGDWQSAIKLLSNANEIMIEAAMEEGYLHDEMDDSPDRKELYRNFTQDGPCRYLVDFMKSKKGIAPDGWDGWHPLLSK